MKLRPSIAIVVTTSACSMIHPVKVEPPHTPPAFVTVFDRADPIISTDGVTAPSPVPAGPGTPTPPTTPTPPMPTGADGVTAPSGAPPDADGLTAPSPASVDGATGASDGAVKQLERLTGDEPVWWAAFADPALDAAIQEGFHNNYAIRDVRGLIYENMLVPETPQGWWWPLQIGILAPAGYQHIVADIPFAPGSPTTQIKYNQLNVDVAATYQVDVWGNLEAQRQVGMNIAEQQRQLTESHAQDLAVQITQSWFDILETRALRDLTLAQAKYNQELYELVKARFEQHLTPRLVVLQQEQLLLNLQSQVPLIDARIALLNSQLHQLLGRMPSPVDNIVPHDRGLPDIPAQPNLGTPADLNANTPELRYAQLRVAEIEHSMNVNLSSWLPEVHLAASVGMSNFGVEDQPALREEAVGVTLTWAMFDGKRVTQAMQLPMSLHRREIQYELAMRTAIARVQDAVIQENNQTTSLRSLRTQVELGGRVLAEARRLFEQGQSDYLAVLTALTNQTDLQRAALLAHRLLLNDRVELYRSLGGTWSYDVTLPREK
jgi:outer membrane protein TolC